MNSIDELRTYLLNNARQYYPNSIDDQEDLVQDTLLKILKNTDKFDGQNLKGWSLCILRNTFINNFRKSVTNKVELVEDFYSSYESFDQESYQPYQGQQLDIDRLYGEIDKLEKAEKACLSLRMKGYKYEEISYLLELNLGTVKSKIFYARHKLKNFINNEV